MKKIISILGLVIAIGLAQITTVEAQSTPAPNKKMSSHSKASKKNTAASGKSKQKAKGKSTKASGLQKSSNKSKSAKGVHATLKAKHGKKSKKTRAIAKSDIEDFALRSNIALVEDQQTGQVMYEKNSKGGPVPIASITKLMTALVTLDSQQPLDQVLAITEEDYDTEKNSRSRLAPGTQLTRGDLMHLALMSSENRAASALGRNYPGGIHAFVQAMNQKAVSLGMFESKFVDATGLSRQNVASAQDLVKLVKAAAAQKVIRDYSTTPGLEVVLGNRNLIYKNTNPLVSDPNWEITLTKTGYISEAGRCLVMQTTLEGKPVVMVLLDSNGKYSRIGDAQRLKKILTTASNTTATNRKAG